KKYKEHLLTTDMLPLCPFDVTATPKGTLIAYRNTENNITIQHYQNNEWTSPKIIKKDNWPISATIETPAVAALNNQVAIAWLSKSNGKPILQLAHSKDEGEQFKMVLSQQKTELVGSIDLIWINSEQLCLTWLEQREKLTSLMLTYIDLSGNILKQESLITLPILANIHQTQLIQNRDEILIAWKPNSSTDVLLFERSSEAAPAIFTPN
ncbi:MAG: hypothetical protein AAFO82_11755, partial [Bacteroidota bacterium]